MLFKNIILALICLCTLNLRAQESKPGNGYKLNNFYDLDISVGKNQFSPAVGWAHLHHIGKQRKFTVGYGIRFTSYFASNQQYITAPARLTSNATGPQIIFDGKTHNENLDTLHVKTSQVNMLNLDIHLLYSFNPKWDLSFNIDAFGLGFGSSQQGTYSSYNTGTAAQAFETAKPTKINGLLVSDNDIGNLNSAFFVRYWLNPKWGLRLGYTFLFAEYTTDRKLNFDNDRFRNKSSMALFGITYSPLR